jgi:hypothetical protein
MSRKEIHWREWDFRDVPEPELEICLAYELAREGVSKAAVESWREANADLLESYDQNDPGLHLAHEMPGWAHWAWWTEFPKPYQSVPAPARAAYAMEHATKSFSPAREVRVRPDFEPYSDDKYSYVALELFRCSSRNAFLEACGELWDKHKNPELPQVTGQGKTSDRKRLQWLGAWRLLKHTRGDIAKAQQICKERGRDSLYTSDKGWRGAAADAERLMKNGSR